LHKINNIISNKKIKNRFSRKCVDLGTDFLIEKKGWFLGIRYSYPKGSYI